MYHKVAIENSPLQAYASALIFSPARSLIRDYFKYEEPKWITIQPAIRDEWSACLQTLEGHSDGVTSVAFSRDSTRLASASDDGTVKIWDASSGKCLQTLEGHSDGVKSVAFSRDSTRPASPQRQTTAQSRSGMRAAANASRRSRATAMGSRQWPSHVTRPASPQRQTTAQSRSGMRAAASTSRRSRLGRRSATYLSMPLTYIFTPKSVLSLLMCHQLRILPRL